MALSRNRTRRIEIGLQLTGLTIFYCLLVMNYGAYMGEVPRAAIYWVASFDFAVLIGGLYCSTRILLPRLFARSRYIRFALAYLALILAGGLAIFANDWLVLHPYEPKEDVKPGDSLILFFSSCFLMLIVTLVGIGIRGISNWIISTRQLSLLREEQLRTELAYLRAQINPHFLFNTLNLIFGHIDKSNTAARDMMLRFSDMMRYQLYECDVPAIDIERELDYLQQYMELQKLRKTDKLDCSFTLTGPLSGFSIPPLLLLPMVENAFKHLGANKGGEHFLRMAAGRTNGTFHFACSNTRPVERVQELLHTNGIGLNNLRRRLELMYPGRHELHIDENDDTFNVQLAISL